jgi:4-amino-4-deoxy-L-arabinose transferase-like glycosyltransferase
MKKVAREHELDRLDYALCAALWLGYLVLLLSTVKDLGYARDEGFYFQAARSYQSWFELLHTDFARALEPGTVDRYWSVNHEHPAFMKSLFALSHRYLFETFHLFREPGTAYRFPGMAVSALGVVVTYAWGRRELGRTAGLVAALSLAFMPRIFYHSHLACFDGPVMTMLLVTTYAYARSLEAGLGWAIVTGVLYGLLLDTKHNAWLLPCAFGLHFLLTRGAHAVRELRAGRLAIPSAFFAMAVLSPLVFYAGWPWIWHDTARRLAEYVAFHLGHEYYNMEFLGQTYWKPPMPRLYAWVMTLATVPGITLALFAVGVAVSVAARVPAWRARVSDPALTARAVTGKPSVPLLWGLCLLLCYAPWWSDATPIFGGTKHWITAYPFLCLFAGRGFAFASKRIAELVPWKRALPFTPQAVAVCVLVGPLSMMLHSHPWGLSFYTPLVGGAPGAASLGLNRTFWGYTTGAVQGFINAQAPPHASVYVHDTALQSWEMLRDDGRVREGLRGSLSIAGSSLALYHHEPHMHRVEYQVWVDYGHDAPADVGTFDGVPVIWVYSR